MIPPRALYVDKINNIKYYVKSCPKDGKCQYHAIAMTLQRMTNDNTWTAERVWSYFTDHVLIATPDEVEMMWVSNDAYDDKFAKYTMEQKRMHIFNDKDYWGNHYTMVFFANLFKITFYIFTKRGNRMEMYMSVGSAPRGAALLFNKDHYDTLDCVQFDESLKIPLYSMESVSPTFFDVMC
jgi:hypothetical protein